MSGVGELIGGWGRSFRARVVFRCRNFCRLWSHDGLTERLRPRYSLFADKPGAVNADFHAKIFFPDLTLLFTAIAISGIAILPAISQATTEAPLCLTADPGRMEIPIPASTREISWHLSCSLGDIWNDPGIAEVIFDWC
jgi:hypothetical protein